MIFDNGLEKGVPAKLVRPLLFLLDVLRPDMAGAIFYDR